MFKTKRKENPRLSQSPVHKLHDFVDFFIWSIYILLVTLFDVNQYQLTKISSSNIRAIKRE